jgi:putative ABC transport system permease protein
MWRVTLKGLLAHKLRFVLTGVSVILGVAFLSGTLVLTTTIRHTFDDLFTEIFEGTDVQVRNFETVSEGFGGGSPRPPVTAAILETVRGVEGVAVANPEVDVPYAQLVDADGDEIGGGAGPPTFGISWDDDPDLNPFRLEPGSAAPRADDEIVIDKGTADKGDITVGRRVSVLTGQAVKEYTVTGIAKFGTADSALGASIVQFTLPEAQRIVGFTSDQFSAINVVGDPGISQTTLRDRVAAATAIDGVEVVTGADLTRENQDDVDEFLDVFNRILLVFAAIALFVSCFIIYNTFTIVVTQRAREMALLRAIGAAARQVTLSILAEAVVVGLLASAIGLGLGILLAIGLKTLLDAIGIDIPAGQIAVPLSAVIASFVVGTSVTIVSALVPARKASRVPPVAAMRDVAVERRGGFGARLAVGLAIVLAGAALMLWALFGLPDNALAILGVGALTIFLGTFVIGPVIARPISRFIGAPLPKVRGMTGTLARENAIRNPRRTAATASALMVGVALVGFITIFAASAKASISRTLDRELKTDFIVTSGSGFGFALLPPVLSEEMSALPELAAVSGLRYGSFEYGGSQFVTAVDTTLADQLIDLGIREGALADVTVDGIALSEEYATDQGLALGDVLPITWPAGPAPATVQAIYEGSELGVSGDFVISIASFDEHFLPSQRLDWAVLATLAPGVTAAEGREAIEPVIEPYPTADLRNNAEYKETQEAAIDTVVNLVYALLFLAVLIALIGIANTLALSIFERTRELGLLRAVGMSRSQVRAAVRWESVIIAVFGTLLGLAIGLFFGWAVVRAVEDEGFTEFAIAPGQLVIVVVVAAICGIGAAVFPARRAAKLDILRAIATE